MAISMLDNISYRGKKPDNERSQFATIADMVVYSENYLPDVYITLVAENGKQYMYQRSNTVDETLGKWRELEAGGGTNTYTKTEIDEKIKAVSDDLGDITSLFNTDIKDSISAINVVWGAGADTFDYSDKKMIITLRNGGTKEIDVSSVITDTGINEFKNVEIDAVEDGQSLVYDATTSKWVNKLIDLAKVLQDAKDYTDEEIVKAQENNAIACDEAPTYDSSTDTVTYKQGGETKTEEDTVSWFYYKDEDGNAIQTRWINGVEFTIDMGAINLEDYINKTTDVTGTFEENPTDLTKIPNLQYMQALRLVLVTALGKKVNTTDIVDNLTSEATDAPLSANQGKVIKGLLDGKLDIQQSVDDAGKIVKVDAEGKLVLGEGSGTAENVSYENENYPLWTTVKKAIDGIIAKVDYVLPEITAFTMTPATTVYEVGQSVASLVFNWTTNKDITTQTLTDCVLADENVRTATFDTPITSNKTFTLNVGDGQNTASKALSIAFRNKIYFGGATEPADYDSAFVLGLAKNQFATSYKGTFALTVGNGEFGYVACPTSMSIPSKCYIGGFETTLEKVATISLTNASGGISSYDIIKTGRSSLGSISMEFK